MPLLTQPYPSPTTDLARLLLTGVAVGVFVAAFLIILRPFGTDAVDTPLLNYFLAGYGVLIAAVFTLPALLIDKLAPGFFAEAGWTVGRQILWVVALVALGITLSYFYVLQLGGKPDWRNFLYFFRNGLIVAIIPLVALTLINYLRQNRRYVHGATAHNARRATEAGSDPVHTAPAAAPVIEPAPTPPAPPETLTNHLGEEALTLPGSAIWCLHSDGNYVEVWHAGNDGEPYQRTLIRNTIKALTAQLTSPDFITCHRSWVVNGALVEKVTGNAQGYQLHRTGAPEVAVARGRSKAVLGALDGR